MPVVKSFDQVMDNLDKGIITRKQAENQLANLYSVGGGFSPLIYAGSYAKRHDVTVGILGCRFCGGTQKGVLNSVFCPVCKNKYF